MALPKFNKPLPKTSVDMFHFAILKNDEPENELPEYEDVQAVPGLTQAGFNSNASTAFFYADSGVYDSAAQTGDLVITLGLADIPNDVRHIWFGQEYKNGLLIEGDLNPPEIAIGYRIKKSNGAYRYVWYYKCKASPPAETNDTQGASVNFQSDSITISCAKSVALGKFRQRIDSDDLNLGDVTPEQIEAGWFTSPTWKPGDTPEEVI